MVFGIEKVGMASKVEEVVPFGVTGRYGALVSNRSCKFLIVDDMELGRYMASLKIENATDGVGVNWRASDVHATVRALRELWELVTILEFRVQYPSRYAPNPKVEEARVL